MLPPHDEADQLQCCLCLQVEVLWVVNQESSKWEAALPADTRATLNNARSQSQQQQHGGLGGVVSTVESAANFALNQREPCTSCQLVLHMTAQQGLLIYWEAIHAAEKVSFNRACGHSVLQQPACLSPSMAKHVCHV